MKIIGSGFGRTGTRSTKIALEMLGFDPCFHMEEVIQSPEQLNDWHKMSKGEPADWHHIFRNYQATVDFPASVYYQALMEAFPDAVVLHTVRDPNRWYESTHETIYQAGQIFPWWARTFIPFARKFESMGANIIWDGVFEGRFEDREHAIRIFEAHTAAVKASVPSEKLLVFSVKDGWEPLCNFLDVPIPDEPFPHYNDRKTMVKNFKRIKRTFQLIPVGIFATLFVIRWWLKRV